MKVLYFAWVRERIGCVHETLDPPPEVVTAGDLIRWLATRGSGYAHAFEEPDVIRVAINQVHAAHDAPIAGADEIAFFPPMTGG